MSFPRMKKCRETTFPRHQLSQVPYGSDFIRKVCFHRVLSKTVGHSLFHVEFIPKKLFLPKILGNWFPYHFIDISLGFQLEGKHGDSEPVWYSSQQLHELL